VSRETFVQVVEEAAGFEALRSEWNSLLAASAANCPFLTWEWLFTWWTHLAGQSKLKLFVVHIGEELVAIAPLRLSGLLPWLSKLEFLGTGGAGSDYLDLIVRRGFELEAVDALAGAIESRGLGLHLTHLRPSALAVRLARRLESHGWTAREADDGVCPVIHLAGHTWDTYLASRGSNHRANVRRRLKGVGLKFDVRFEQAATTAQRLELLTALASFHDARFNGDKSDKGSTAFQSDDLMDFHRDVTALALDANWLRMYALYLEEQLAGVMYAFSYGGRFYFYQHGFDQTYRDYSPGLLLMALTINTAIAEGAAEFDLLWGVETYKFLWADDLHTLRRLDLFPARFGGRISQLEWDVESMARSFARRLRTRTGHVA
jgi:CelD/BcsL family acetyltransferase involved in cellulose biosynthesis